MNKPNILAIFGVSTCLTNIFLNCLFIPQNGLLSSFGISGPTGAATATVLSVLINFFGLRWAAKKLTGTKLMQSHTPRHIIAGLVMAGVLYHLAYQTSLFPMIRWYTFIWFAGLGLGIYLGVLFLLKEFKKQDLLFFLDMLHPKEMIGYISSELCKKPKKPN